MKRLVVLGLIAGALMFAAGAQAVVQNKAFVTYKNMAGTPFAETESLIVSADLVGPQMTVSKSQQNGRTLQGGTTILISSGDTIIYTLSFNNLGSDSATQVVITDTMAFDTVVGQTTLYEQGSAYPDQAASIAGGTVTALEYYNGSIWQGTTSGLIPTNAKGIRWTISLVTYEAGPYAAGFTVKVTSP